MPRGCLHCTMTAAGSEGREAPLILHGILADVVVHHSTHKKVLIKTIRMDGPNACLTSTCKDKGAHHSPVQSGRHPRNYSTGAKKRQAYLLILRGFMSTSTSRSMHPFRGTVTSRQSQSLQIYDGWSEEDDPHSSGHRPINCSDYSSHRQESPGV
jgi:hypothetical protein